MPIEGWGDFKVLVAPGDWRLCGYPEVGVEGQGKILAPYSATDSTPFWHVMDDTISEDCATGTLYVRTGSGWSYSNLMRREYVAGPWQPSPVQEAYLTDIYEHWSGGTGEDSARVWDRRRSYPTPGGFGGGPTNAPVTPNVLTNPDTSLPRTVGFPYYQYTSHLSRNPQYAGSAWDDLQFLASACVTYDLTRDQEQMTAYEPWDDMDDCAVGWEYRLPNGTIIPVLWNASNWDSTEYEAWAASSWTYSNPVGALLSLFARHYNYRPDLGGAHHPNPAGLPWPTATVAEITNAVQSGTTGDGFPIYGPPAAVGGAALGQELATLPWESGHPDGIGNEVNLYEDDRVDVGSKITGFQPFTVTCVYDWQTSGTYWAYPYPGGGGFNWAAFESWVRWNTGVSVLYDSPIEYRIISIDQGENGPAGPIYSGGGISGNGEGGTGGDDEDSGSGGSGGGGDPVTPVDPSTLYFIGISSSREGLEGGETHKRAATMTRYNEMAAQLGASASGLRGTGGRHVYDTSNSPQSDLSDIAAAQHVIADGYGIMMLTSSQWSDMAGLANGSYDSDITSLWDSKPSGMVLIHNVFHEPENNGWNSSAIDLWRKIQARMARLAWQYDDPTVYYTDCRIPMYTEEQWNWVPALEALDVANAGGILQRTFLGLDPYPQCKADGSVQTIQDRAGTAINYWRTRGQVGPICFPEVALFHWKGTETGGSPVSMTGAQQAARMHQELWDWGHPRGLAAYFYFDVSAPDSARSQTRHLQTPEELLEMGKLIRGDYLA